ncbi:MAG TPA: UPF0182 family protein [Pyrinomonadaceae bacterium]|nr:UPF0182 family protein [Pyrinomonadaceae bacterium]
MSTPFPIDLNDDDKVIDIGPSKPKRRGRRKLIILIVVAIVILVALFRSVSIYISALWFGSLGYSSVYWYIFRTKLYVFLIFAALTIAILRGAFWLLERAFSASTLERRTVVVNNQTISINPARLFRPAAWILSILIGLGFGLGMKEGWREIALYLNQPVAPTPDPIFQKPLSFYLFSLPVHQIVSGWLIQITIVILIITAVLAILSKTQKRASRAATDSMRRTTLVAVSISLAAFLIMGAWRTYLARFPYLWQDHQSFSGVTYTEANYYLPALLIVAIALLVAAAIILINAFTMRKRRFILAAIALPLLTYVVAGMIIPAYVQSFVVKPNELGREMPYIEHNITWTRRAFGLERIEMRDFEASDSIEGFDLADNRATLDNIRLWDWSALRDTLRQIQEIRPYYDFQDVDVDRYQVGGQTRQMMLAARELDVNKLPEQSRTWINEKLIYTHGYGVTMNTANEFTPEGMPRFILSNMPIESSVPEIKLTRPEIYFGQKTDTDVYVKTKQVEFNFPQGETDNTTVYEGTGGIQVGGFFHKFLLAWALGDLSKLPFSDAVTPDSRLLMRRNIRDRVNALAPFLVYDDDPYIVVTDDGRLFWIIDAYTESQSYPYSRHTQVANKTANYIRNSVKVTIDAYNGDVNFYVFDTEDPLINAYRSIFPALFKDNSQMPADLRRHVRYPETLIRAQGDVFGLYHTTNPSVFFQRNDVWSVASQVSLNREKQQQQTEPLEPYFVLMQLPGEQIQNEFVEILPFTPANKNNMIGWVAGRSDGENYGHLLVYNFPRSRLIDGPLQIEARIDQDSQLSGQFSLWNQQGSRVRRGNLLVIPIGRSLLYVEPVYLQAERSPMPELRLVVLATQDHLVFGSSFQEAVTKLFGEGAKPAAGAQAKPGEQAKPEQTNAQPKPSETPQGQTPQQAQPSTTQQLINRASDDFAEYQRLTAEGKLGEAGQKLDALKRDLEELKKATGKQ